MSIGIQADVATAIALGTTGDQGLDLPLVAWEGGPDYWSQFAKADAAGWSDPSFFPISVFLGKPDSGVHPASLASIGVNTYAGVEHNLPLTAATDHLFVIPQHSEWTVGEVGSNADAVGWLVHDEPDLNISLATYQADVTTVRNRNDDRFIFTNFAHGILRTHWWSSGTDMQQGVRTPDAICVDQYAYTSPGIRGNIHNSDGIGTPAPEWPGPGGDDDYVEKAATYGWCVDQLRSFDDPADLRPMWITVETKMPFLGESNPEIILYAEIAGAVWSSIAHEARGIMYFQHNGFYTAPGAPTIDPNTGVAPDEDTYSLVDCEQGLRDAVEEINSHIAALAPVLNTQSYVWDFSATGVDTMLKAKDGFAYIFASIALGGATGSKTFTMPSGVNGSTADVLNESRSVNISGGQFSDSFANEYSHHIYKVAL